MNRKEDPLEKARRLQREGQARAHSPATLAIEARVAQRSARTMLEKLNPDLLLTPEERAQRDDNAAMLRLRFSTRERKKLAAYAADKGMTELEAVRELTLKALAGK